MGERTSAQTSLDAVSDGSMKRLEIYVLPSSSPGAQSVESTESTR